MRKQRNIWRAVSAVLAVLVLVSVWSLPAAATETKTDLQLYRRHAEENQPFQAANMLPGDSVTKTYRLQVSYKDSITVHFWAEVRPGYEKLAEVLRCRVTLNGAQIYDGLMASMPHGIAHTMKSPEKELEYQITAYLDTSVGNEYMAKELLADFRWWVDKQDEGGLEPPPKTGDEFPVVPTALMMGISAALIVFFLARTKKKEAPNEGA